MKPVINQPYPPVNTTDLDPGEKCSKHYTPAVYGKYLMMYKGVGRNLQSLRKNT